MERQSLISEEDGEEVVDSLNQHGLLSPVIDEWRLTYLKRYDPWFSTAREVHALALKTWTDHWRTPQGQKVIDRLPTASRIFGRGINNLAAGLILCERGSAIEAASLARSISEASFWLGYLADEPVKALSDLDADDLKNWIEREQELQRIWSDNPEILATSKANQARYEAKLAGRTSLSTKKIAQKYGTKDGYLKYRIMSGFYSHLSHTSLSHNLLRHDDNTAANILGPHSLEIPQALYFACDSLIDCGAAYSVIVDDQPAAQAFSEAKMAVHNLRERRI